MYQREQESTFLQLHVHSWIGTMRIHIYHTSILLRFVHNNLREQFRLGCALTFASEAKFEIEAKISFRLEAKQKPDFT